MANIVTTYGTGAKYRHILVTIAEKIVLHGFVRPIGITYDHRQLFLHNRVKPLKDGRSQAG